MSILEYLPKQWNRTGTTDGDITACTVELSTDGVTYATVATPTWAADATTKIVEWTARQAAYLRITVTSGAGGYANISGLRVGGRTSVPALSAPAFPVAGATYRIVNRNSGMVVDVSGRATANGSRVIQWPWNGGANQKWTFVSAGDGYWKIRDTNSGKLLEVSGLSRADAGATGIWDDTDAPQQHWAVSATGDGHHVLTNRFSGLVLDVANGATTEGAAVDQHVGDLSTREQWQLVAV